MRNDQHLHLLDIFDHGADPRWHHLTARQPVQQTERCRVKVEERKHQSYRCQRFLTTRQQRDSAIAFPRRLRHHRHTSTQQIFADELKVSLAATKELRKTFGDAPVDLLKGLFKSVTCFAIDTVNSRFQRR